MMQRLLTTHFIFSLLTCGSVSFQHSYSAYKTKILEAADAGMDKTQIDDESHMSYKQMALIWSHYLSPPVL